MSELEKYKKRLSTAERKIEILEEMIEQKVRELYLKSNEELNKRNKELERKYWEMEHFAYIASHDLQEPLRRVCNISEFLYIDFANKLGDKGKLYIDEIISSSERMTNLIQDLLTHGKIGSASQAEEIDLNILVQNVLKDIELLIIESKATIHLPELPVIRGYKTELALLFQNLLSNAIKFKSNDRPVEISFDFIQKENKTQFSISDNGMGIEEKYFDKIFEIFNRLHSTDKVLGTGIGLSHCAKIVALHQGEIWLNSELNVGSTFHFTIGET